MKSYLNQSLLAISLVLTSYFAVATEISQQATESVVTEASVNTNQKFGSWLFEGHFKQTNLNGFNEDYRINIGDTLTLQLWGALEVNADLNVDKQGNVFIPRVGPVKVAGILNKNLNNTVVSKIKTVYKSTVNAYVNLKSSQPVKVFVSGFANKPGLYEGLSSDSVLAFIDQAKGIRNSGGSMRFIEIKRNNTLLQKIDLYDFLENGNLKFIQFKDGDVIHINENNKIVNVKGEVANSYSFELTQNTEKLNSLTRLISPKANATHIRIISTKNSEQITAFYPIEEINNLTINASDIIDFVADNRVKNISVRVEGEHNSSQEFVLKRGTTLQQLLKQIEWSELSEPDAAQLYRKSVQQRQQQMIEVSANSIQESVLNARSATAETAKLRQAEAELILRWVEEAKKVQAKGQVILDANNNIDIVLENEDVIRIPKKSKLIMVHGQVTFPTAVVYNPKWKMKKYIENAGGLSNKSGNVEVYVLARNGSAHKIKRTLFGYKDQDVMTPGSEIYVLPKVEFKGFQATKEITSLIYQVALSAGVLLAL